MSDLVFLEPNNIKAVPFTTSKVISDYTGIGHRKIKAAISKNKKALETFGLLASYGAESTGGRPEEIINLNEQQATLLITFLKNTESVVGFKTELVKQFYLMRDELNKRKIYREQLKPIRRELTDVIKDVPDHSKWDYKLYTDLSYKSTIGKTASQLRKERGAGAKAKAIDYMTAEEIARVTKKQVQIGVLVEMGIEYQMIKSMVMKGVT